MTRQEDAQREGQETIKKLKVHIHETEVTLKSTHTQIAKRAKATRGSYREGIRRSQERDRHIESKNAGTGRGHSDDDGKGRHDDRDSAGAEKAVQTARADFAKWEKETRARLVEQQKLLEETKVKLKEVETTIPAKFRGQYDRVVARLGHEAMAAVAIYLHGVLGGDTGADK